MIVRLLPAALAVASLLLASCQTVPDAPKLVPPEKRDPRVLQCPSMNCYPDVDPRKSEWVRENISVKLGDAVNLHLVDVDESYDEPAITPKTREAAAALNCSEQARRMVRCRLTSAAKAGEKYGYTINIKGKPPYDPFLWPRD